MESIKHRNIPFYSVKLLTLVLFICFFCNAQPVQAEPMYIEFTQMMQQANSIVLADYLGVVHPEAVIQGEYRLLVRQVLKGHVKADTIIVNRAHGSVEYDLKPNDRCVAFLNAANEFEWVGTTTGNIEKDLLGLRGFYDYNAYMVAPSGLTLGQLKEYIATGQYSFAAKGALHFYNPKTEKFEPSAIQISLKGNYPKGEKKVSITGLDLGTFKTLDPNFSMPGSNGKGTGGLSLVYESNMIRPLKFSAEIYQLDEATQIFEAMFWVKNPEEMNEAMFKTYLANPQHDHPYYEVHIQTKKGAHYLFTWRKNSGSRGYLTGFGDETWNYSSFSDPSDKASSDIVFGYYKKEKLIIRMQQQAVFPNHCQYPYYQELFIRLLRNHDIEGEVVFKTEDGEEKVLDQCTLSLKTTHWNKNINFRE